MVRFKFGRRSPATSSSWTPQKTALGLVKNNFPGVSGKSDFFVLPPHLPDVIAAANRAAGRRLAIAAANRAAGRQLPIAAANRAAGRRLPIAAANRAAGRRLPIAAANRAAGRRRLFNSQGLKLIFKALRRILSSEIQKARKNSRKSSANKYGTSSFCKKKCCSWCKPARDLIQRRSGSSKALGGLVFAILKTFPNRSGRPKRKTVAVAVV